MDKNVSPKDILKNGGLFVGLILITFYVIFHNNNMSEIIKSILSAKLDYIIIAIICSCTFVVCEGINIRRNLRLMKYDISILTSIKYAIVGFFFSSVTPSASGGQPMQVYYMHKDEIEISHSSLALLMDLASFQFVTAGLAIIGYICNHDLLVNTLGDVKYLVALGIVVNTLVMIVILTAIFSKRFITKLLDLVCFILTKIRYKKVDQFKEKAQEQLKEYKNSAMYIKENKGVVLSLVLTTTVQIVSLHSVSFWIYKAFGLGEYSFFTVVMLQSVLYISVSAIPLPGAVGVSESAFMLIYRTLFPANLLSSAMLVSRGVSFYLIVLLTSIVIGSIYIYNLKGNHKIKVERNIRRKNFEI